MISNWNQVAVHRADEDLGGDSERSSLSPVEDEATTSCLELFQISALNDSGEACLSRNSSDVEESAGITADKSSIG